MWQEKAAKSCFWGLCSLSPPPLPGGAGLCENARLGAITWCSQNTVNFPFLGDRPFQQHRKPAPWVMPPPPQKNLHLLTVPCLIKHSWGIGWGRVDREERNGHIPSSGLESRAFISELIPTPIKLCHWTSLVCVPPPLRGTGIQLKALNEYAARKDYRKQRCIYFRTPVTVTSQHAPCEDLCDKFLPDRSTEVLCALDNCHWCICVI